MTPTPPHPTASSGLIREGTAFGTSARAGRRVEVAVLWRITKLSFGYPWRAWIAIVTTLAAAVFQLLIPQYVGQAVDAAQGLLAGSDAAQARDPLMHAALLILGASVLRGLFTMIHNHNGEAVGHCVAYQLRLEFYRAIQRLSFGFHDRVHSGELITRGMLDLEGVRMFFNTGVVRVVLLATLIGAGSYLLLSTDLVLGALSLSFVPFVAWRSSATRLALRQMWLQLQERLAVLTRIMEENLGGIRVVRAFAAERHEMAKFDRASDHALELARRRVEVRVVNTSAMTFAYFLAMGLVLWVGGQKVLAGEITVGRLAEFLAFMTILQLPVRQLGLMVNSFARGSTCGARLFEVLDRTPDIRDRPGARALEVGEGVLRFEDVHFAFDGAGPPLLHGITFEARPGQTVGIVGPPGSGKSTIVNLIPRFYDATAGRIAIDGQDVRDVTLESLRRAVGVVQQDSFLFTASIENNIAYGDPWSDQDRITDANRIAQLHAYVDRLPIGYGTLVGERGVTLSGGQRQRLSIARSVLLKPRIMVFDDSTAAVDAATEQRIRTALREVAKERATIIISHRLSSLMHADEILFLEAGRIVERGTHEQLVAQGGRYAALYRLQVRPGEDTGVRFAGFDKAPGR